MRVCRILKTILKNHINKLFRALLCLTSKSHPHSSDAPLRLMSPCLPNTGNYQMNVSLI